MKPTLKVQAYKHPEYKEPLMSFIALMQHLSSHGRRVNEETYFGNFPLNEITCHYQGTTVYAGRRSSIPPIVDLEVIGDNSEHVEKVFTKLERMLLKTVDGAVETKVSK